MKLSFRRGGDAVKQVQQEKKLAAESRKTKLWEFFPPKDGSVVQIRFLTDEPLVWKCHQVQIDGKWIRITCTEEFEPGSCKECEKGNRPQDVAGWLVWDSRPFEVKVKDKDGNDSGKKKTVPGSVKPLIRGMTDAALIQKKNEMFGLLSRPYLIYKTGEGKQTKWTYDHGDVDKLTKKQLDEYLATLPESLRGLDPYEVMEKQIVPASMDDGEEVKSAKTAVKNDVVEDDDDEEDIEEEAPAKKKLAIKRSK